MNKPIRLDILKKDAQARAAMSDEAINEYAENMRDGEGFPPIVVFHGGNNYWLADGFHRVAAAENANLEEIEAEIKYGELRDALLHACGANQGYGVRRTNADKRRAVTLFLEDDEWRSWGNREIARHCGVDEALVRKVRDELCAVNPHMVATVRKGKRGGKDYSWSPSRSKPTASKSGKRKPTTPDPLPDRDGFATLQTVWQGASQDERKQFVAWARDDDPGAFARADKNTDPRPIDINAPAIAPAPAPSENAPQPENPAPEGNGEPPPAINGGATPPLLSANEIDSMDVNAMLSFVREHGIEIPRFDNLPKHKQRAKLKEYIESAGAERRNAA